MKLPRYPKYKDSGVKWLGEVPENWETRRIRFLFRIKKRIAGSEGYDVLSITQQGIKIKDIESNDGQLAMDYSKYQFVEIGDFAMNHMDLLTGYVDISGTFGVTSPDYRVFSMSNPSNCHDRYFLYVFQNAYRRKIFYPFGQGASQLGRWRLPTEQFQDFALPFPSMREQRAITDFLDREVEKIDSLIGEQQRLIELLKEKRQAVISHAVTIGLNPEVPMKASGIDSIQTIPFHWRVVQLRRVIHKFVDYRGRTPDKVDVGIPLVTAVNVKNGRINFDLGREFMPEDDYDAWMVRGIPETGDVLVTTEAPLGEVAQIEDTKVALAQRLILLKANKKEMTNEYLKYFFLSAAGQAELKARASGSTALGIKASKFKALDVAVPPVSEQGTIVKHLDELTAQFDALAVEASHAVEFLKERRSALISAAVTGQIDVRNYRPEEAHAVCQ